VFESGTLKNIFRSKRNKITGEWIRLHNDELHDLALLREYFTDDRIKKNEHVVSMGGGGGEGLSWGEIQKKRGPWES